MVAMPKKLVAGRNSTFVPTMLAVQLVGLTLVILYTSLSGSLSLTRAGMLTGVSSTVVAESLTATGASCNGVTVMVTVASALSLVPSLARKVKLSGPV